MRPPLQLSCLLWYGEKNQLSTQEKQLESHVLTGELLIFASPTLSLTPAPLSIRWVACTPSPCGVRIHRSQTCRLSPAHLQPGLSPESQIQISSCYLDISLGPTMLGPLDMLNCSLAHSDAPPFPPFLSFISAAFTPIGCLDPAGQSTHLPHHCPHCPGNLCSTECFSGNLAPSSAQPP